MPRHSTTRAPAPFRFNGLHTARTGVLALTRMLCMSLAAVAAPLTVREHGDSDDPDTEPADRVGLYIASVVLVLLGGAFAGLTIALMGQDGIYLQVLAKDENEPQRKNAIRVYNLLQRGKHWVLVTLLLSNVIVNETLPVVLDRCLGGGVAAVVGSTFLIVIFGEVLPQSVCVRYGLPIGGFMSKPVLVLMWLMSPLAWPTAKLLDWVLGEENETVYKKSGLKTLITLHRSLGEVLSEDEVTIISAVLDLKEKSLEYVMTPMEDVFVMSADTVLDEKTIDMILSAGYSRIPVHEPGNPTNFVGMLLVKILITYDPEDCKRVKDFSLATLPETRPETSCLDILNFYQEGKSHMVLVSEYPGEDHGALGVVTLEDIIEELIGEEIVDESDVYEDIHKMIRRKHPAPKAFLHRRHSLASDKGASEETKVGDDEQDMDFQHAKGDSVSNRPDRRMSASPKAALAASGRHGSGSGAPTRVTIDEMMQQYRHLGPSNKAANPRNTKSTMVKIKPGNVPSAATGSGTQPRAGSIAGQIIATVPEEGQDGDETTALLRPQFSGKDGVHALQQSYGSVGGMGGDSQGSAPTITVELEPPAQMDDHATQTPAALLDNVDLHIGADHPSYRRSFNESSGSLHSDLGRSSRSNVRSGSITENIIESRGIRKIVLETTSSNEEEDGGNGGRLLSHAATAPPATGLARTRSPANVSDVEEEADADADGDEDAADPSEGGPSQPGGAAKGGKKKTRRKKRKGSKS